MFSFTVTKQFSDAIKELSEWFIIGTTSKYGIEEFTEIWKRKKDRLEDLKAIRDELADNRRKALGYPGALQEYVIEINTDLTIHCQKLEALINTYLENEGKEWDYYPVLPELRIEGQTVEEKVMPLFVKYASELETALQRICAVINNTIITQSARNSSVLKPVSPLLTMGEKVRKKTRGKSNATKILHEEIRYLFDNYTKIDKISSADAYASIRLKKGCSDSTIDRALKGN